MKKILITLVAILTLLCGCQVNENTNASDYGDDIAKAQEISVVSAASSEVLETISSKDDIEHFIQTLDLEKWKFTTLPDNAAEIGSFRFAQEETIKYTQTDTDGELHTVATITLYDGSYIGFETGNLNMTFKVSEAAAEYLNGYFV